MCAVASPPGYPDLHHPLQYRKQEALWKRDLALKHREFCSCGNFLFHFKWPSGEKDTGDREDQNGEGDGDPTTGDIVGGTGGGEGGDVSDIELLR
nr:ORF2 [Torque teno Leptonychotes weddellii virus 1]WCS65321.1 ORF2 [Torque teno Leptonychotes weddellii virus 1]WCS65852.1 ORF2 [Torque teno Leptonychotes weddellii virus 1]